METKTIKVSADAEKKKRIPKSPKTQPVKDMIALIPFLNSDGPLLALAVEWAQAVVSLSATPGMPRIEIGLEENELREHRDLLLDAIRFYYGLDHKRNSDELGEEFTRLVNELDTEIVFVPAQDGRPGITFSNYITRKFGRSIFYGLSVLIFHLAMGGPLEDWSPGLAAGRDWIGACPRCGKVFEKKQANAEYCGKYCATEGTRKK